MGIPQEASAESLSDSTESTGLDHANSAARDSGYRLSSTSPIRWADRCQPRAKKGKAANSPYSCARLKDGPRALLLKLRPAGWFARQLAKTIEAGLGHAFGDRFGRQANRFLSLLSLQMRRMKERHQRAVIANSRERRNGAVVLTAPVVPGIKRSAGTAFSSTVSGGRSASRTPVT